VANRTQGIRFDLPPALTGSTLPLMDTYKDRYLDLYAQSIACYLLQSKNS